ncbi:MAG: 3,4-dihydroxy-2-butanone-4-phosphate synthase [Kiloniellales bacterium]
MSASAQTPSAEKLSAENPRTLAFHDLLSPIEDVIEDARNGRMFVLVDDEDRENEGDLVIPAQMCTPDAVNFMAMHGRGLICLAMTHERIEQLQIPLMSQNNGTRHQTAFTVSIEAKEGVTTGISAPDRARTIAVAIDPAKGAADLVTPGHVFPLVARDGGVLERIGHTEAAVDIARLAGLNPAGVICEVMNDDGTMARRDDLIAFAQRHGLKVATIAELVAYRRRKDRVVERKVEGAFDSRYGGRFQMALYENRFGSGEHLALWKGDLTAPGPVPVRVHAFNLLDDVLGDLSSGRGGELWEALAKIEEVGRGVVVLIGEPGGRTLAEQVAERLGHKTAAPSEELRDYGIGAQILLDLGVKDLLLLHTTKHVFIGLEGYGLTIADQQPLRGAEQED